MAIEVVDYYDACRARRQIGGTARGYQGVVPV
jgi:hypothetical protein